MTDRHDEDNETSQVPTTAPPIAGEGVRIIGAEEAQAVVESGAAARRLRSDTVGNDDGSGEEVTGLVEEAFWPDPARGGEDLDVMA